MIENMEDGIRRYVTQALIVSGMSEADAAAKVALHLQEALAFFLQKLNTKPADQSQEAQSTIILVKSAMDETGTYVKGL